MISPPILAWHYPKQQHACSYHNCTRFSFVTQKLALIHMLLFWRMTDSRIARASLGCV